MNNRETSLASQIKELRAAGKSYNQIVAILGCAKSSVTYHAGEGQKQKWAARQRKNRNRKNVSNKLHGFRNRKQKKKRNDFSESQIRKQVLYRLDQFKRRATGKKYKAIEESFGISEFFAKFSDCTHCYLSGRPIDINNPNTWQVDHKVPRSRGGKNDLKNLEVARKEANSAKNDLTVEEFLNLCEDVLKHHGYTVEPPPEQNP